LRSKKEIEHQLEACRRQRDDLLREGRNSFAQFVSGWISALEWVLEKDRNKGR